MARCPDCNKFVSYGEAEPEVDDFQVFEEETHGKIQGEIQGSVRVVLECAECGTELKEATMDVSIQIEHECEEGTKPSEDWNPDEDDQYEVTESSASFQERYETKTPTGKTIKNPRYMKKYYGAEVTANVKCHKCQAEWDETETVEEQASFFDEC